MKFNVTVEDKRLLAHLEMMVRNSQNLRPVFEEIADDFLALERRVFESQGGSNDHPWPPLGEWAVRKGGSRPLVLHGYMERSLTVPGAKYGVRRITRNKVTLGTKDPVTHLHQSGTQPRYAKKHKGKPMRKPRYTGALPARPVVFITDRDQARWRHMFAVHVHALTPRLGL